MPTLVNSPRRRFTEAARIAAAEARKAKREGPDTFGSPELFVVKAGERSFTWELRRFGGVLLQRGPASFDSMALARIDGEAALVALHETPELPTFKRSTRS